MQARFRAWLFMRVLRMRAASGRSALVAVGAGLSAALLAWTALGVAVQDELDSAIARRTQLRAQLDAVRTQVDAMADLPPQAAAPEPVLAPWRWQLLARDAGLQLDQLLAARTEGETVQLRLRGRYHQHGAWVALLASDLAAPAVRSYQLQAAEGGELVAEVSLQPWPRLPETESLASAALASFRPLAQRDPFSAPPPPDPLATMPAPWRAELERPPRWLEGAAMQDLEFTGTLRRGTDWVALLRWERMLHTVGVGDTLGHQRGRVQRIDEHGLWLREVVPADGGRWQERERHWRVGERP